MENREEIKTKLKSMSQEELIDFLINKDVELENNKQQLAKKEQKLNWYKERIAMLKKRDFYQAANKQLLDN